MAERSFEEACRKVGEALRQLRTDLSQSSNLGRLAVEQARLQMKHDRDEARAAFERAMRRRPPRPLSGLAAPVRPKPNPSPLQGGAFAPTE